MSAITGPTYVTAQTLVQQVAYLLSDKVFSYSPETFDLDVAVKDWSAAHEANANGCTTSVHPMQVRNGAGTIALGYMFSKDFDLKKRHIPQGFLAASSSLQFLRPALEELSLLYSVANPFVGHIAAVDYDGSTRKLVTDYDAVMSAAEDLGFGLVSSQSAHESQHMALLATLLAQTLPTFHVIDGVRVGRETTRVIDVLDKTRLTAAYDSVLKILQGDERKHLNDTGKVLQTLNALNEELGTDYQPFEVHGHENPYAVLVCFGSVESSLASQVAVALAQAGCRIAVVSVRIYRPFLEDEFLKALPKSAKVVAVLGQVPDDQAVLDSGIRSHLFEDVLAAMACTVSLRTAPSLREIKYARTDEWTPSGIAATMQTLLGPLAAGAPEITAPRLLDPAVQRYSFWDVDESVAASAPRILAQALARDSAQNVTIATTNDNLVQGGVQRTEIRKSPRTLEAPFIDVADTVVVGDVKLLEKIDILKSLKDAGNLIVILPGIKDEDVEKQLLAATRREISHRGINLFFIDSWKSELPEGIPDVHSLILQTAFLRVALPQSEETGRQKLAVINSDIHTLGKVAADLDKTLRQIEIPKEWSELEAGTEETQLPVSIVPTSFTGFDKSEAEPPSLLRDWQKAAKGLLFKEAYGTRPGLRPDLPQKTYTVHVKENRRLTPLEYDRNIFHIEFDLGSSGLKYDIGEALGVHAENDHDQVMEFIKWYKLNPDDVVEIASREDPSVLENRTVYQALMQNIDIFGRPPKKFYEALAEFARDENEKKNLLALAGPEGFKEFQRRAEVDTVTFADVLAEFPSAHPSFHELVRIVSPMKRREYSIASCQKVTPNSVALMVVVVNWVDPRGRDRFGQATRYLSLLPVGAAVTVSVKPSVMKLPPSSSTPIIMAGLGTGLAPFRAFVQHRALEKQQGKPDVGPVLLYMGSRHQRQEYCYGEEWEAYASSGVITLLSCAFSRDQPHKIYIQDRMRETMDEIVVNYLAKQGSFYLCGPTWPVPDVTGVLQEAISIFSDRRDNETGGPADGSGKKRTKVDAAREIMKLKDEGRYVLEVY